MTDINKLREDLDLIKATLKKWCPAYHLDAVKALDNIKKIDAYFVDIFYKMEETLIADAWSEFEGDYLTDGNGYAPASTYDACYEAFGDNWHLGSEAAYKTAQKVFIDLHGPEHIREKRG